MTTPIYRYYRILTEAPGSWVEIAEPDVRLQLARDAGDVEFAMAHLHELGMLLTGNAVYHSFPEQEKPAGPNSQWSLALQMAVHLHGPMKTFGKGEYGQPLYKGVDLDWLQEIAIELNKVLEVGPGDANPVAGPQLRSGEREPSDE